MSKGGSWYDFRDTVLWTETEPLLVLARLLCLLEEAPSGISEESKTLFLTEDFLAFEAEATLVPRDPEIC